MTNLKEILKKQEEEFDKIYNPIYLEVEASIAEHLDVELKAWHNKAVIEALDAISEEVIGEDEEQLAHFTNNANYNIRVRNRLKEAQLARYTTLKKEYQENE